MEHGRDIAQVVEQYIEFRAGLKNKIDGLSSNQTAFGYRRRILKLTPLFIRRLLKIYKPIYYLRKGGSMCPRNKLGHGYIG